MTTLGLVLVLAGEILRKTGILTAKANFTHRLQIERRPQHVLVISGIYSKMRHPGYAGWVMWAIGTQVLLCNPICIVLFTYLVSWEIYFFKGKKINGLWAFSDDVFLINSPFYAEFEIYAA